MPSLDRSIKYRGRGKAETFEMIYTPIEENKNQLNVFDTFC